MGLKPIEVKALTLKDFNRMLRGHLKRQENQWDVARHIMWATINFGGMGIKKMLSPQEIYPLSKDRTQEEPKIQTLEQAESLLDKF